MTLSFHIRHEVTPERTWEVFTAIASGQPYDHIIQYDRQATRLRQLGLLTNQKLTRQGLAIWKICQSKPDLWAEIAHFLHYTLWRESKCEENGFSWTYKNFTDHLWQVGNARLNNTYLEPIVSTLINQAELAPYFEIEQTQKAAISLSRDSLRGAYHWLQALIPPVIEDENFNRRYFCPPELIFLSIGWVAQQMDGEIGIDYLITPERREAISKVCLLEPSALDRVLDWMLPNYPDVVQPGTSAGTYGRFLRFLKWPEIDDLLP